MGSDEAGVRRRGWAAVAVLAALVCALALPAAAAAEEFVVNGIGDEGDAALGDETCLAAGGECTLRAAIEEANETTEEDRIEFAEDPFEGTAAGTVALGAPLPAIEEPLYVHGTECPTEADVRGPCVGIAGPPSGPALTVDGAAGVTIEWLAVTDAEIGVKVVGSESFKAFSNWFGVGLDGEPGPNTTGLFLGPGSDSGVVGSPGATEGNLFANSTAVGLDLHGASHASVRGNVFGIEPASGGAAANGKDIEITSEQGGAAAVGNEIGTRLSTEDAASPACDRGCNVISGSVESGVDLDGDADEADEAPAVATKIVGNYLGLTRDGSGSVPGAGAGISVGAATETVIGGPRPGDANRISGGSVAVEAGPAASELVVQGNRIGTNALGQPALPPAVGLAVDSEGLAGVAEEAVLAGNAIRLQGGTGISQHGAGAWIVDNEVSGAATGIKVFGSIGPQGNLIEGNTVVQSELDGILVENDSNELVGNRITGSGGAGIAVHGGPPFGINGNTIGGDSAAQENEIGDSGGAAIAIVNPGDAMTAVARNHGASNGGLFIDLVGIVPGSDPNGGIAPPPIAALSSSGAAGTGDPGATVRVFRKQTALAGEVEGFLGAATVDEDGNWSLLFASLLPPGTSIAVTQTSAAGGTSELGLASIGAAGASGGGPGAGGGSAGGDRIAPRTAILKAPKARTRSRTARFLFASDELGTSFQCRLDRRAFRSCASPKSYAGLRPGKHAFAVRAVDAAGNPDPSPAKRAFTILPPR